VPKSAESATLTQTRVDLCCALRSAQRLGLNEGVCNHFSVTVPGNPDHFLINPQGFHWSEITPADLMLVDRDGKIIAGKHSVEPTAFFIHYRIHRGSQKNCVLHTHMPYATALSICDRGRLSFANQNAMRFFGRVAYDDDYQGVALSDAEGDRMCSALGQADVLFLASHGVIVCGESVAWAFDDLYYLERSCLVQVLAESTGRKLREVPEPLLAATAAAIAGERQQSDLHFDALRRVLDREEPGWRHLV
jgi:ribulose-5-phosphate 4-epimerase/fuculose-1-phosphate aldolase